MRLSPTITLLIAIFFEVIGTVCMKLSDGFSQWLPSLLMLLFYGLSFLAFVYSIKRIEISIAYALWTALGMLGITLFGFFFFNEEITLLKGGCLVIITLGVVGLTLDESSLQKREAGVTE